MYLLFTLRLQSGAKATCNLEISEGFGSNWLRFTLDTSTRQIAGLWLYFNLSRDGGLTAIADVMNAAIEGRSTFGGELYFDSLRVSTGGDRHQWKDLVPQGRHWMGAGRELPIPFSLGPANRFEVQTDAKFGPQGLPGEELLAFIEGYYPGGVARYDGDMEIERTKVQEQRTYGLYKPYGQPGGAEAGGKGVAFFHHFECIPTDISMSLCAAGAISIAHKTDTLAVDAETGLPLLPSDLADSSGYLPFDMHANTNDTGRIPQFNNIVGGPENIGQCSYREDLKKHKQNDPEHYSRAILFLQGLISYVPSDYPLSMWARATMYRRAAHLRMWKPEIDGKGSTMYDLAMHPTYKGFFDRDEGWVLHTAACAHWATRISVLSVLSEEDLHWSKHAPAYNHVLSLAALNCAMPTNSMHQARSETGQAWSSKPWAPDKNGNVLKEGTRGAYTFQECIIIGGIRSIVKSGAVKDEAMAGHLIDATDRSAKFLFSKMVESSQFKENGMKMGPPDIIGVQHNGRAPSEIEEYWGAGHIVNTTMVAPTLPDAMRLLGVRDREKALKVIGKDTRDGYSGALGFSAPLALELMAAEKDDVRPPVLPPMTPPPQPDQRPGDEPGSAWTDRDQLRIASSALVAIQRDTRHAIKAITTVLKGMPR